VGLSPRRAADNLDGPRGSALKASMNILVDHGGHSDLYHSFHCLFEKRLGGKLYFPIGDEWIEKGYLKQHFPPQGMGEAVSEGPVEDGIQKIQMQMEPGKGFYTMVGITFQRFLELNFEVIITSTYYNEEPFYNLVKDRAPNAVFLRQIANIHEKPLGFCKNILIGAAYHPLDYNMHSNPDDGLSSIGCRQFTYYPEQYEGYRYSKPTGNKRLICLSKHMAPQDKEAWDAFKRKLTPQGYSFQLYGSQLFSYSPDPIYGRSVPHLLLPKAISESDFIWYTKPHGGGGYTVRQALASGRPVILRRAYSEAHTSIECQLFKHGVNCIDLGQIEKSPGRYNLSLFKEWSKEGNHEEVCKRVAETFSNDTRFEETAKKIGAWIKELPKGVD